MASIAVHSLTLVCVTFCPSLAILGLDNRFDTPGSPDILIFFDLALGETERDRPRPAVFFTTQFLVGNSTTIQVNQIRKKHTQFPFQDIILALLTAIPSLHSF